MIQQGNKNKPLIVTVYLLLSPTFLLMGGNYYTNVLRQVSLYKVKHFSNALNCHGDSKIAI